jgi:hypothetical protein
LARVRNRRSVNPPKSLIVTKALACKLAKAAWHMMKNQTTYDEKRMFPELVETHK